MRLISFLALLLAFNSAGLCITPPLLTNNNKSIVTDNLTEDYLDSIFSKSPYYKLDEIVIMGFKQDKSYQLSPQSAISLSEAFLESQNITNIKDITSVVSNLYMPDYGSKLTSPIYIRGIGNKTGTPSIGLYIDGIPYFQQSTFDFDMHQIKQIDVLKGPQGTLYGRNTMGGVIDVHTISPLEKQERKLTFTGGNHNHYVISTNYSLLLKPNMGLSISGSYTHNGGYFKNTFLNKKADKTDAATGRVRYDWKINQNWLLKLISSIDYTNQGGYPYSPYNSEKGKLDPVAYDGAGSYKRLLTSNGVNLQYQGDGFKINSQSSFQYYKDKQKIDQDFTPKALNYTIQDQTQYMGSEEVTIKSDNNSKYQWLFGAFGFYQEIDNEINVDFIPRDSISNKNSNVSTYGVALYHQSTLNDIFIKGLSLSAGLRFDYEHAQNRYNNGKIISSSNLIPMDGFNHKLHFNQITPKFTLQYISPTEQNIYATVAKGYKTGGFNTSFINPSERTYKPEYSWNYEIGTKLNFFQNKLKTDIALFYIDWRNQQVNQPLPTGVGRVIKNAGKSASKGVEVGLSAQFTQSFVLKANYGYTKAYYRKYDFTDPKGNTVDYKNKRIPRFPSQTVSAEAMYTFFEPFSGINKLEFCLNYIGTGKIYWDDMNKFEQRFYNILNARATIYMRNLSIAIWSKNITNSDYSAYCFFTNKLLGQSGKPFTIGGTLTYSF